jgi:putative molybdopterin biosynthesis protein
VSDLAACTVALRGTGTGTRVLLERLMHEAGADPSSLRGPEVPTHLEAAVSVAAGLADAAVGLRAAADTLGLDFVPLIWEPFELALPEGALGAAGELMTALGAAPAMPGFDLADAGAVTRP